MVAGGGASSLSRLRNNSCETACWPTRGTARAAMCLIELLMVAMALHNAAQLSAHSSPRPLAFFLTGAKTRNGA